MPERVKKNLLPPGVQGVHPGGFGFGVRAGLQTPTRTPGATLIAPPVPIKLAPGGAMAAMACDGSSAKDALVDELLVLREPGFHIHPNHSVSAEV